MAARTRAQCSLNAGPWRMAWVRGAVVPGDAVAVRGLAALKGSWSGLGAVADAPVQGGK